VIIDPEYHYEAVNVENGEGNPSSLLWWMKRLIAMRKRFKALGLGTLEFLFPDNSKVLAFIRQYKDETIVIIANLSRLSQAVELDLSKYAGFIPEEIFSKNKFPAIKESPYVLTLTPYDFYWFSLQREEAISAVEERIVPEIDVKAGWITLLEGRQMEKLEEILPNYIKICRWFGGKARIIQKIRIIEKIPISGNTGVANLLLVEIDYTEGLPDTYLLPISFASKDKAQKIIEEFPRGVIARLRTIDGDGILYDSVYDEEFRGNLLSLIARRKRIKGKRGELIAYPGKRFRSLLTDKGLSLDTEVLQTEQSNTSIIYKNTFFLKLFRRLDEGINPDLEITRFLTEKTSFLHSPPYAGAIEYKQPYSEPIVIGILQGFVQNQGEGWRYTLDAVGRYFERVLSRTQDIQQVPEVPVSLLGIDFSSIPPLLQDLIGGIYLEIANLLGNRTGELHLALSSLPEDPNFAPESFSLLYQRAIYQSMRSLTRRAMQFLDKNLKKLPENIRREAAEILSLEPEILRRLQKILQKKISAIKIRVHGDYHLGQVLYTGNDFVIFDFEGEPERALSERRLKYSPLRDVAAMIRSFHYAAYSALLQHASVRPEDIPVLEKWADLWYHYVSGIFLSSYLNTVKGAPLLPDDGAELENLLNALLLEKAVYELSYELNNRPDWVVIPIRGIKFILRRQSDEKGK